MKYVKFIIRVVITQQLIQSSTKVIETNAVFKQVTYFMFLKTVKL